MKRLPITQDFNGGSKSSCKCHVNLGWVATHDCISNNSITVRFGNSLEVGQGAGPRRIPIYFWCHKAEQVVAERGGTSKQPPPEKLNHLTNKRNIYKRFSGWWSCTPHADVLGKTKSILSFCKVTVFMMKLLQFTLVWKSSIFVQTPEKKGAFHHPTANIQFELL